MKLPYPNILRIELPLGLHLAVCSPIVLSYRFEARHVMSHEDTLRELVSILIPQNEARPTALLGAGASFSSGVPLAAESVKRIVRRYYAERISGNVLPEQVKTSEWLVWLADQTWFIRDPAGCPRISRSP